MSHRASFSKVKRPSMDFLSTSQSSTNHSNSNEWTERPSRTVPKSTAQQPALSSSYTQRPPARSLVSQGSIHPTDPAQYSSLGVREQTAELASLTFSTDHKPTYQSPSPAQRPRKSSGVPLVPGLSEEDEPLQIEPGGIHPSNLPEVIEEQPEPSSPEDLDRASLKQGAENKAPEIAQPSQSALSSLFRTSKFPSYGSFGKGRKELSQQESTDSIESGSTQRLSGRVSSDANETSPLLYSEGERPSKDQPEPASGLKKRKRDTETRLDIEAQKKPAKKKNTLQQVAQEAGRRASKVFFIATSPKTWSARAIWNKGIKQPVTFLPCVFLGLLLNILDGLSYGMILYPLGETVFAQTGPDGISMFYVSCIVSQLVYSFGGSQFKGAVGSEMIEIVPFFHKMAYAILDKTGESDPHVVLATVTTSFAMSAIVTGIVFFLLGAFKLGSLVSFFPRHILIGCVGGVGFFLIITGVEVSARLDGNLEFNLETGKALIQLDTLPLWLIPLGLAIILSATLHIKRSPFIAPAFFVAIVVIFYIVVTAASQLNVPLLRDKGWIFPAVESGVPFYNFYSYYDFKAVDWEALATTIPTMFALTFFGVLHVPINVPALAITAGEDDLNLNRELVSHGISNALSGMIGSVQNYLVYVNSAMFIENGGNNRLAGVLLAAATFGIWVAGPEMIGYVPIMVVGSLIFYLGFELLEEALVDPWGKMSRLEYLTVVVIVLVMGMYDFVGGIVVGIVLACLNFVVQTSRKSAIRARYSGEIVESTVRRHPIQRRFLHEVGHQIYVTKLSGFLFFGSIVRVEKETRALIDEEAFDKEPIRFLVFDLFHVYGVDYSAVQAFSRIERVLKRRQVQMIISGIAKDSDAGKSLQNIGLWTDESDVGFFESLNDALEFCENVLLRAFYKQRDAMEGIGGSGESTQVVIPKAEEAPNVSPENRKLGLDEQLQDPLLRMASPRTDFLTRAATNTLDTAPYRSQQKKYSNLKQPLPLILTTFHDLTNRNEDFWFRAVPYFERADYTAGTVVFQRGEEPDAFYLLEAGILRAEYDLPMGTYHESIVAGTTCGELPFFSATLRTATVSAERDCVTWKLSKDRWEEMRRDWPDGASEILTVAMKLTKERVDAVVGYVLTAAG